MYRTYENDTIINVKISDLNPSVMCTSKCKSQRALSTFLPYETFNLFLEKVRVPLLRAKERLGLL
jgi:hypothetical protein